MRGRQQLQFSLVQDSGAYQSSCGYCNDEGKLTSTAHGMHAYKLTVYDYQELLDQGWRRSGKYLYKPDNELTCCRQYTIRLDVTQYQASRAHKKLLRKWERFLAGEQQQEQQKEQQQEQHHQQQQSTHRTTRTQHEPKRIRQGSNSGLAGADASGAQQQQQQQQQAGDAPAEQQPAVLQDCSQLVAGVQQLLQQALDAAVQAWSSACGQQLPQGLPAARVVVPPANKQKHLPAGTSLTSSCAFPVAAAARKQQLQQQQQQSGSTSAGPAASLPWSCAEELANALAVAFNALAAGQPHTPVSATAAKGHVNFSAAQGHEGQQAALQKPEQQEEQQGGQQQLGQQQHRKAKSNHRGSGSREQQQQHDGQQQGQQQQQQHRLEVRMVPNSFIQEEYDLYVKYQVQQHHDDHSELTPSRYKNFLVDSPLIPVTPQQAGPGPAAAAADSGAAANAAEGGGAAGAGAGMPACGYGSFHQQYWLDGRLVAVGVVDVLPRCLSSKYFFWDPDYAWLALGRYGAVREISWVQDAHAAGAAGLAYYYMGFYIHGCPKMSYKAEYEPSELLCPARQVWVTINNTVRQALDQQPYVVLSDLPGVSMQRNLSVPRPVPGSAAPLAAGQAQQQQQQAAAAAPGRQLDSQLLFLLKQPVRWGALRESGMLDGRQIRVMEERLGEWRGVVGETASNLLYATPSDLLPIV